MWTTGDKPGCRGVVGGWESVRRGPFGKEESMGLLAGGRWGRQAQAPEPGLGGGGRSIAGGRGPGGAQVAIPRAQPWGDLKSKEPGGRWRCRARERPGRRRGFGAGQEGAERRQGRESPSGNARVLCWRRGSMFCLECGGPKAAGAQGGSVGSLTSHCPGLRPPASASSPPTPHRALAGLWNFPGGNSPQRPSGPT